MIRLHISGEPIYICGRQKQLLVNLCVVVLCCTQTSRCICYRMSFLKKTCPYLCNIISQEGIKHDPEKLIAISNLPTSTDKPAIHRLHGIINFLANHIPNMATITALLCDLVKQDTLFQWGPEHHTAVGKLKAVLSDTPVLQYFDAKLRSIIQADASQHSPGCNCLAFSKAAKDLALTYCSRGYCVNILATRCRMGMNLRHYSQGKIFPPW